MSEYFEKESILLGILDSKNKRPLKEFHTFIESDNITCWYSYLTDYTLLEYSNKIINKDTTDIDLTGNDQLTDQGIIWMCQKWDPTYKIEKILLRSCSNLTETSLFAILGKLKRKVKIDMSHTSIKYVPKEIEENFEISTGNCLLAYQNSNGLSSTIGSHSVIIWPSKSINFSGISFFGDCVEKSYSENYLEHLCGVKIGDKLPLINIINYRLTEVPIHLFVPSNPGQIMIILPDDIDEASNHIIETVAYFLASSFPTVECPKIIPPIHEKSNDIITDDRSEILRHPKQSKMKMPQMKMPQKKMMQKKNFYNEELAEVEDFPLNNSLLETSKFGYKNISIRHNIITKLSGTGVWISKIPITYSHSTLEIKSLPDTKFEDIKIGICNLTPETLIYSNPESNYIFLYDLLNGRIYFQKNSIEDTFNFKEMSTIKSIVLSVKCRKEITKKTDTNNVFISLNINEKEVWSHVLQMSTIENLVPFITISQQSCSFELFGDWNLTDSILIKEMTLEPGECETLLKFIAVCVGAKSNAIFDEISKFDWNEKLQNYINKLNEFIENIKIKDPEFIDFNDCMKLSKAKKQLEQIHDFIKNVNERLFIYKMDTINKEKFKPVLSCIETCITKATQMCLYKYVPNSIDTAAQQTLKLSKNYITLDFVTRTDIAKNVRFPKEIFEKLFSEGYGIYVKKFQFFILNIKWFDSFVKEVISNSPSESNYKIHGVHSGCKVWTLENLNEVFNRFEIEIKDNSMWIDFFMYLGFLIRIPCIRKSINDESYLFLNPMTEGTAKKLHLDDIRKKAELIPQKLEVRVKYEKICQDLYSMYPQLLSNILSLGQPQLISPVVTVLHINGGIEFIIEPGTNHITLSGYMIPPIIDGKSEKFTLNLMEYLWSIMHLFTDAFEALLIQQNVLCVKSSSVTQDKLKNYSICYSHNWLNSEDYNNICSLCGNCSSIQGIECPYNRINSQRRGVCLCLNKSRTCADCGICGSCANLHWSNHCETDPNRLITCKNMGFPIPTKFINPFSFSKFIIETFHENPDILVGLNLSETTTIFDIFGGLYSDINTKSLPGNSSISFMISDLHFYNSDSYQYFVCYGVNIIQELGIITYNCETEVGLFVGRFPISKERNKFSIEILNRGEHGRISIGLVPYDYAIGNHPGWIENSIAYHGDDGGIFNGEPTTGIITETFSEIGNRIEAIIEYENTDETSSTNRYIIWNKNGRQIKKFPLKYDGDLYPTIGLHSANEQVKLLDNFVWKSNELVSNVEINQEIDKEISISPKNIIYFILYENAAGIFHVILKKISITSIEIKIVHKYDDLQTAGWMLESLNKLNNSNQTPGKWVYNIFSNSNPECFTFRLKTSIDTKIRDWMLKMNIVTSSGEIKSFQFQLTYENVMEASWDKNMILKEVNDQYLIPSEPSFLLTTTLNSITTPEHLEKKENKNTETIKYYHIPKANYLLILKANRNDAWIKCSNYIKPNYTRSFQIGNMVRFDSKVAMVISTNKNENQMKITGTSDIIKYNDLKLRSLANQGKPLLTFKPSTSKKFQFFSLTNKSQLLTPPPSRPWIMAFNLEKEIRFPIEELFFATECNEYHGLTLCLLNSLSTGEDEIIHSENIDNVAVLPFNNKDKTMTNFLWEHSLMDLINVENLLFYPFCAGKSSHYDSRPHLIDIEGISIFNETKSPADVYKAIFLNSKLLEFHRSLINFKFLLPKCERIFQQEIGRFSNDEIEYLICSILQKLTNYMILINLFSDDKCQFSDSLKGDWNRFFQTENVYSFVLDSNGISCKLHSNNYDEEINLDNIISPKDEQLNNISSNPIFDYAKCSQSVILTGKTIKEIPEDIFSKFVNLNSLELSKMFQLEKLPKSIYYLKGLQRLIINQVKINILPDVWEFPNLKFLQIDQCPITSYNENSDCIKLEHLKLQSLPLLKFPNFFCFQENLITLHLQLHGMETLPMEFCKLKYLKELTIKGSPLYYELSKNDSIIMQRDNLDFEYPEINNFQVRQQNTNSNVFLSAADVFINVPRVGSGYSETVDTINMGGFPMAVLQLKNLVSLKIQYQSIRWVPSQIEKLEYLEDLDLSFNPLLERVASEVTNIATIKKLTLLNCPSLSVPPSEIVARGSLACLSYLKFLLAKNVICNRTKLMFVGLGEAGKTCLLSALKSDDNTAKNIIDSQSKEATDGIDVTKWTVSVNDEEIQYSTWDFAGQDVYYNTHQFFLSEKAIYIVVWSVRQGIEHGDLDFWLSSICCHGKNAPIFVVGTRCDQVQADTTGFSCLKKRYPQIEDFTLVDSYSGTGIKDLKQKLVQVTLNLPYMHQAIPSTILELEKKFIQLRNEKNYITYTEFEENALSQGIIEKDVKPVLQILHDFGSIQYFNTKMLNKYVVINPQWIVDIMSNVVSVVNQKIKNGIFYHDNMKDVWKNFDSNLYNWMLNLTEEFDLTYPDPTREPKANIVPCLLSEEEPDIEWPLFSSNNWKYYYVCYKFYFLPAGLFNRIQVRLFDFTETKNIWKYGTYFVKNEHHVLFKRENKNWLTLRAVGVRPINVMAMVDDVIKELIKCNFHGIQYNLEISCPDCVEYGTSSSNDATKYWSDVSMIPSKLIKKAFLKKVAYLQCSELHLNSIKSIKKNTPETPSAEEFIDDLMIKKQTIKSLYASSNQSIVMLYSTKDFTESTSISMSEFDKIFTDLNLSCIKINESSNAKWKISISNSQLCIICLSENFIQNVEINEIVEYIKMMKKKFILLIMTDDKDIRQKWEYYLYFQTVFIKVYGNDVEKLKSVFEEIKQAIQVAVIGSAVNQTEVEIYDCFISYCWANSQDAVNKGTKNIPGAIISSNADPRKLTNYLNENGIKCWIDTSNMDRTSSLNKQLSRNLKNSKMMIAFVSNEYNQSENCLMELTFMVNELKKPVLYVSVGSHREWLFNSEIHITMSKKSSEKIDFTDQNLIIESKLLEKVRNSLKTCQDVAVCEEVPENKQNQITAYIEQVELISRQVLNQLISFLTEYCPRLVVLDIDRNRETNSEDYSESDNMLLQNQVPSIYNLKLICECESNWHITDDKYPIPNEYSAEIIENCAVYLYMIYEVLEYKNPGLICLEPDVNHKIDLISKIVQIASSSSMTLKESYANIIKIFMKYDSDLVRCSLKRYRLPSGRKLWMCDKHAALNSRCKLIERDTATIDSLIIPVQEYDKLLLSEIKSKAGEDLLKHTNSFKSIVDTWKNNNCDSNDLNEKIQRNMSNRFHYYRSDTNLILERNIITNKRETSTSPIRTGQVSNNKEVQPKILNRRTSAYGRQNLMGSRICSIQ